MLIATLIHWDRFNHGDAPLIGAIVFYGWVVVYIISPLVVLALWWFNRRTDSGEPAPGEAIVPAPVSGWPRLRGRRARRRRGVLPRARDGDRHLAVGSHSANVARARLLHRPGRRRRAADLARPPVERLKLIVETFFVATALLLVGAIRAWSDFDTGNPMTYLYIGGLVAADVALLLLYRSMSHQEEARAA
jgi:hypothetical protein